MKGTRLQISTIVCAHNEEQYIAKCLTSLIKALRDFSSEIILVADRCTDNTVKVSSGYGVRILNKTWRRWKNSYSESLQLGYSQAKGDFVSIVDADIIIPQNFFHSLNAKLQGKVASAAAGIATYPDTIWNRVMNAWEKTYSLAPLGREPYGAARLVKRRVLDVVGGFRDTPTPDTDLDMRFAARGYVTISVPSVTAYHIRHVSPSSVINGQIVNGRGRYALGLSFVRTLGHSVFRIRPFVIAGWLFEWEATNRRE